MEATDVANTPQITIDPYDAKTARHQWWRGFTGLQSEFHHHRIYCFTAPQRSKFCSR
jgi:hypothetical protein